MPELYKHEYDVLDKIKNGRILCGGVGSGKSITSLSYYYKVCGGNVGMSKDEFKIMSNPIDLYIITTARKRDTLEWDKELAPFRLSTDPTCNYYKNKVVIDSWNNIKKYKNVIGSFFIFDEQRVVGSGAWVKAFLDITRKNKWILLSATPGDKWEDYIPVFVANGFYKNKTAFTREHIVFSPYTMYPKIDRYLGTSKLNRLRREILVDMEFERSTTRHDINIFTEYDRQKYKDTNRDRWDYDKNEPITTASNLCYTLRKITNSDNSRLLAVKEIIKSTPRVIIFYNFTYELELLRSLLDSIGYSYSEWNGQKHQPISEKKKWAYLVQYTAGAEGWNCIKTDSIIFYSQNYSYRIMEQSSGRIDRLNTPYKDLYYYHLKSKAPIDLAISRALSNKKKFNERKFVNWSAT